MAVGDILGILRAIIGSMSTRKAGKIPGATFQSFTSFAAVAIPFKERKVRQVPRAMAAGYLSEVQCVQSTIRRPKLAGAHHCRQRIQTSRQVDNALRKAIDRRRLRRMRGRRGP